jgi:hypothetical protein
VELPAEGSSRFDLAIYANPLAVSPDASIGLTRDGVLALMHALETVLDDGCAETTQRRPDAPQGPDWWASRAQAA